MALLLRIAKSQQLRRGFSALPTTQQRVVLAERAAANPLASQFVVEHNAPLPELREGTVLVRNRFVSVEPAMKGWISTVQNYASVPTGDTMFAFGVGEVVASALDGVAVGALVAGRTGWQEYGAAPRRATSRTRKRDVRRHRGPGGALVPRRRRGHGAAVAGARRAGHQRPHGLPRPPRGRPPEGRRDRALLDGRGRRRRRPASSEGALARPDTRRRSAGSAVGQLAKRAGCRAVGVAGGAAKAALCVDAFAYDACVDYKATGDLAAAVAAVCSDGVDVFYDMVGGDQLDAVAPLLNVGARVVVVGTAGTAAWSPPPRGLRLERHLLVKRASMAGFLVFDHAAAFPAALDDLARLVADGSLVHREEVRRGLAAAPRALEDIYRGANAGKLIIAVP